MKIIAPAATQLLSRVILRLLAVLFAMTLPLSAQAPSVAPAATEVRGVARIDGPWRFAIGDDPRYADPGFDDSSWRTVKLSAALSDQNIESYSGYAWYRLRLEPQPVTDFKKLSAGEPLGLLVTGNSVGQLAVYVNGFELGRTRGMTDPPSMYQSPAFTVPLSGGAAGAGPILLAIRTWEGPDVTIHRGLLTQVEVGGQADIADRLATTTAQQWDEQAVSAIAVAFLFLGVAILGAALYLAQRNHAEYIWLSLLCLTVVANGAAEAAFGLALVPLSVYRVFMVFSGRIFMAVTLEFVRRFTASQSVRLVRIVQICVLILPFAYFIPLDLVYQALSVTAEVVFCGLICVLLFRAWREGRGDAGIMLVPFFLAATADSADTILSFAAARHWLPEEFASPRFHFGPIEFGIGTVAYTVFLGSLIAVILYRFIRVSQVEQRSNAEIAAARSVQALLIPTQLPSNRNFMLESAYLPVNGVGGDFFQVLPLKDDSLLIVVGDVSGKGLQAAMNSSTLVGALRNELSHDPATILDHLNRVLLGAVSTPGKVPDLDCAPCFATCLCARVYTDGELTIANAGHLSPYRDGRELDVMPGLPLGVIADMHYEQTSFTLEQGDRLVFLSDGVVEATNPEGELFGFERTQQVSHEPARYIAQTAKRFGQTDDITVVSVYIAAHTTQRKREEAAHSS